MKPRPAGAIQSRGSRTRVLVVSGGSLTYWTDERSTSRFTYRPTGPASVAEPGSLEFFLIERYLLFSTTRRRRLRTGRVHHPPCQFSDARVEQ